jgi:hypothetical protein
MPEPFTWTCLFLAIKAAVAHTTAATATATTVSGSSHLAAILFVGVAAGSVIFAICECLERLVNAGVFSQKQVVDYKERAVSVDDEKQRQMLSDAKDLCEKWNC